MFCKCLLHSVREYILYIVVQALGDYFMMDLSDLLAKLYGKQLANFNLPNLCLALLFVGVIPLEFRRDL